jgi:hypothetical protein
VDVPNNEGIWATDRNGLLRLIVRKGDPVEVAFNDRGQLAFGAGFTDGSSGIFISDLVAIPEPVSFALTGSALAVLILFLPRSHRP